MVAVLCSSCDGAYPTMQVKKSYDYTVKKKLSYDNLKKVQYKKNKQVLPFFVVFETRFWNIAQARLRILTSALDSPGPELPSLT